MCTIDDKSRRVLKPRKGLRFFSVRNHKVESYGKDRDIQKGIYNIDGFQIRFYTEKQIQDLASARSFGIL